jgi:hypothetical protein
MNPLARVRHHLARRPWLYAVAVAALALMAGLLVHDAVDRIDAARRTWGEDRHVLVAARDGAPGDALRDVAELELRPAPMVPEAALSDHPAGDAVLRQHVRTGEVVVDADVVAAAGPSALVPEGWRAVAIAESTPLGALVGDGVEIAAGGLRISEAGVVVATGAGVTVVAVPAEVAPTVAHAATTGEAVVLLTS